MTSVDAMREALRRAATDMMLTPRHNRNGVADDHIRESRERIRAALSTLPSDGVTIPAGWVLVPRVADEAMVDAANATDDAAVWEIWSTMLAAAPKAPPVAQAEGVWRERWYGSEPEKGSAITDERGNLVAYFGGDETTHAAVTKIVALHNAALSATTEQGDGPR
jgi:hypothetical protein